MSKLSKFLWGSKHDNPANKAMPYVQKGIDSTHQLYDPYVQQGQRVGSQLEDTYNQQASDPNAYYNKIAGGYQQSAGFNEKRDELLRQAQNTAASGGFAGGEQHQKGATGIVDALMNEDFQKWYNNVNGINTSGIAGQQNLYNTGYNAAGAQSGDLANLYGTQGNLAAQGQDWTNRRNQNKANTALGLTGLAGGKIDPAMLAKLFSMLGGGA